MDEKNIYTNSILTFAFTNDGQIIVKKDENGKIDTLPWLFMGRCEKGSKPNYEDSIWVINGTEEYKEKIATFFVYYLRDAREAFLNGFFVANANRLMDVGELYEKILAYQIEEMKNIHTPSFIRAHRGLYDGGINQRDQQIINKIETRYVVLPSDEQMERFPELEVMEFDKVRQNLGLLSDKMLLGLTGEDGRIMETFVNQLSSLNREVGPYFKN